MTTKNLPSDRPSRKLANQNVGPFKILEQVGHSFRLDLHDQMGNHPVVHARFLRKDPGDPLPGQVNPPPEPISVTGEQEWDVEKLLAVRRKYGKLEYKVDWVGADEDPTYYPASNFKYSPHKIRDFHLEHPELPGPPRKLGEWLKAWEQGVDNYDELEDDK
jgi:hypothetical protein